MSIDEGMGPWPDVTIALLVRSPGDWELETATIVRQQDYDGRVFVHVVDSSPDPEAPGSATMKAHADAWQSIPPSSFHHGTTRNLLMEGVETDFVVFLSSDAHPTSRDWLKEMMRPLALGEADVSYGRQRPPSEDPEREATYGFLYPDVPEIKTKESVKTMGFRGLHFSDVTSAYRTEVLQKIPFPSHIAIFQDAAMMKLMLDAGYRIAYTPAAEVLHAHPMTWRGMWDRYRGLGEVWQRLGLFDDLKAGTRGGLVSEGIRSVVRMVPRAGRNPVLFGKAAAIGLVKGAAVARGRRDAKKRPPLALDWTPEGGSRAVRR